MRSVPIFEVRCDERLCDAAGCPSYTSATSDIINGELDNRDIEYHLRDRGWRVKGGRDICPDCAEKESEAAK